MLGTVPPTVNKTCARCVWGCKQTRLAILEHCKSYTKDKPMWTGPAPTVAEAMELPAKELIEAIDRATNVDALRAVLEREQAAGRPRTRVMKAARGRLDYICNWKEIPGV